MSLAVRVIPCLDVAAGRVVKGLKFENLRDAGDPVEAARPLRGRRGGRALLPRRRRLARGARDARRPRPPRRRTSSRSRSPWAAASARSRTRGRSSRPGADRVTVNTAAVARPGARHAPRGALRRAVRRRRRRREARPAERIRRHDARRPEARRRPSWPRGSPRSTSRGAGEILLTSMDADGTKAGFDLAMLRAARAVTTLPIVASGGAGELAHFAPAVLEGGADAVLAASRLPRPGLHASGR